MTTTFEETLAKIKGQASVLENLDERAVELGVVIPLLKQLGWDTEDLTQIYPQKPVTGVGKGDGKVDYALQVDGEIRVFIEVKRWRHDLTDEDEGQLRDYCLAGKPSLAALTNGRQWRLYLPPLQTRRRGHEPDMRQFLVFNVTHAPEVVEENFRQFLAHDKMLTSSSVRKVVREASSRYNESQSHTAVMNGLAAAWNKLANDKGFLAKFVESLAKDRDIDPSEEQIQQFIRENEDLVQPVTKSSKPKPSRPTSFTLQLDGEAPIAKQVKPRQWNVLLQDVCLMMFERHPDDFERKVLEFPESFSNSAGILGWEGQVGDTGIYFRKGGSGYVREICPKIVSQFGYSPEALIVQES